MASGRLATPAVVLRRTEPTLKEVVGDVRRVENTVANSQVSVAPARALA
jgi:hypothetical protein